LKSGMYVIQIEGAEKLKTFRLQKID
jgi:hypothetical protein